MPEWFLNALPFAVTAITGGLAGALINTLISRRLQRTKLALEFIEQRSKLFSEESEVIGYLTHSSSYNWSDAHDDVEVTRRKRNYNKILKIGNWYNMLAYLYLKKHVNRKIIEAADLDEDMINYCNDIKGKVKFENYRETFPCLGLFREEYKLGNFRPKTKCGKRRQIK